jgi:hypothetical protein
MSMKSLDGSPPRPSIAVRAWDGCGKGRAECTRIDRSGARARVIRLELENRDPVRPMGVNPYSPMGTRSATVAIVSPSHHLEYSKG